MDLDGRRRLAGNAGWLVAGTVLARGLGFVAAALVGRALGATSFGVFSYALTLFVAFSLAANLGLENLVVRSTARAHPGQRDPTEGAETVDQVLGTVVAVRTLALLPGAVLVAILVFGQDIAWPVVILLFVHALANASVLLSTAVLRGREEMRGQTLIVGVQGALTAALVVGLLTLGGSDQRLQTVAALSYAAASLIAAAVGWTMLRRRGVRVRLPRSVATARRALVTNLPFTWALLGLLVFDRQAVVVIERFGTDAEVGWFNAVYLLILALVNLPLILINSAFPTLSRAARAADSDEATTLVRRLLMTTVALGVPLSVLVGWTASWVVPLLFGQEFAPAAQVLRVLAVAVPFLFAAIVLQGVLQALDRPSDAAVAFWIALAIGIPATVVLAAAGGHLGGVWGYVVAAVILAVEMGRRTATVMSDRRVAPLPPMVR
ncbi:oligosaccharide flippase family protein [Euzebya tangerina]|uniref:oligosaccharide flippase family protein n=1 Tax=Euzebya tangerina TaxID=591198 RepID=UPI000E31B4E1|nr:oligosaccharide flippase family protein [Euzebya tangerina]